MKLKKKSQYELYDCNNPKEISKWKKNLESQISTNTIIKKKKEKKNWLLESNPKLVVDTYHITR